MHFPPLPEHEVHIWCLDTALPCEEVEQGMEYIPEADRKSVQRFQDPIQQRRQLLSGSLRRGILAGYSDVHPAEMKFILEAQGKPRLDLPIGVRGLQFSVSHCREMTVLAVTRRPSVGIDLEYTEEQPIDLAVAERICSKKDWLEFQQIAAAEAHGAFYRTWTRKEAYLKATGSGLTRDPRECSVQPSEPGSIILQSMAGSSDLATWKIESLLLEPRYMMAIAAEEVDWIPKVFRIN